MYCYYELPSYPVRRMGIFTGVNNILAIVIFTGVNNILAIVLVM